MAVGLDRRSALALAAGVLLALTAAPAADAATVTRANGQIAHAPDVFDDDVFVLTQEGGDVVFSLGVHLAAGNGCESPLSRTVTCAAAGVNRVVINLEDQDDAVSVGGLFGGGTFGIPITIDGGSGHDQLSMGSEADIVTGGTGPDTLLGGAGNDTISAGDGDDTVSGADGNDALRGDAGADELQPGDGASSMPAARDSTACPSATAATSSRSTSGPTTATATTSTATSSSSTVAPGTTG